MDKLYPGTFLVDCDKAKTLDLLEKMRKDTEAEFRKVTYYINQRARDMKK